MSEATKVKITVADVTKCARDADEWLATIPYPVATGGTAIGAELWLLSRRLSKHYLSTVAPALAAQAQEIARLRELVRDMDANGPDECPFCGAAFFHTSDCKVTAVLNGATP